MTNEQSLAALARLYGVQTAYLDPKGQSRAASPESLLAVIRALGGDIHSMHPSRYARR